MVARGKVARQASVALAVSGQGDEVWLGVRRGSHDGRSWPSRPRDDCGGNNRGTITEKTQAGLVCGAMAGCSGKSAEGSSRGPFVGKRRWLQTRQDTPRVSSGQH